MSGQKFQMVKVDDIVYPGAEVAWVGFNGEARVIGFKDGRVIETAHPLTVIFVPDAQYCNASTGMKP